MIVIAKKGSSLRGIETPQKYDSEFAAVNYCLNEYGNDYESYTCQGFTRESDAPVKKKVHYLTEELFMKASYLIFEYSKTSDEGTHKSVIRVSSENMSFDRKEYFNDELLPLISNSAEYIPCKSILSNVHGYQDMGYKMSKGRFAPYHPF